MPTQNFHVNVHSRIHNSQKLERTQSPSTGGQINKMYCIQHMKRYSATKSDSTTNTYSHVDIPEGSQANTRYAVRSCTREPRKDRTMWQSVFTAGRGGGWGGVNYTLNKDREIEVEIEVEVEIDQGIQCVRVHTHVNPTLLT